MANLNKFPSQLNDEELADYIEEQIANDVHWRQETVDLDKCVRLYEAYSGSDYGDGLPQENLIKGAVEDALSVAVMNLPKARLKAIQEYSGITNTLEKDLKAKIYDQTEKTLNAYVKTILTESQYNDTVQMALSDSAIFGVGYLMVEVEDRANLRDSYELRDLIAKTDTWTNDEAKRFKELVKKIRVNHVDARDVYWQHSTRKVDNQMLRVSVVKRYTTDSLQRKWAKNKYSNSGDILPGRWPHYIRAVEKGINVKQQDRITAEITTWIIEPYNLEKTHKYYDENGKSVEEKFPGVEAFRVTKVIVAGGQMVHRETTDYEDAIGKLPIIPFYLRQSKDHPYGFSIPLQLEHSQMFYNLLKAIQYKAAKKSVSNQGVAVIVPNLGEGDEEELDYVLENGGVAKLQGNTLQGPVDIKNMVMPLNYTASSIQPSIQQAMMMERKSFEDQAQSINLEALSKARSGAGKRAQASANDRTKTISLNLLSKSVEDVYELIYETIRVTHRDRTKVTIRQDGGSRENVILNEEYEREIPMMDDMGKVYLDPNNPDQLYMQTVKLTLNDTSITMTAEADGRGNIPLDPIQRLQYAVMLQQNGHISPLYAREIILDDDMIARDDQLRHEEEEKQRKQMAEQMQMQQQAAQQQAMQQGMPSMPQQTPVMGQDGMPMMPNVPTPESFSGNIPDGAEATRDVNLNA